MNPFLKRRKPPKPRKDREYGDGRKFLADKSELRQQVFERSGGRCEETKEVIQQYQGRTWKEYHPCNAPITIDSMELSHRKHGHGFRDDSAAGCIASCHDCHQNGKHGSKCTYPRRAGKIMNPKKAQEYWRGKVCFCSTPEQEVVKPAETSFCDECLSRLPAALRHDIENTQGKEYLEILASCETALMQWKVDNES